jgi:hypothetical protein
MSDREVSVRRAVRLGVYGALVLWTAFWVVDGWAYLQQHSIVVQQGFGADGIQLWEVFNIKMIAAHHAVRWLGGIAVALTGLYLFERNGARRARALSLATERSYS